MTADSTGPRPPVVAQTPTGQPVPAPPSGEATVPTPVPAAPALPTRRGNGWRIVGFSAVIVVLAGFGAGMLGYLGDRLGPTAFTVGVLASLVPVPLLVLAFLWLDRYEPEPTRYLLFCFAWGACVATAIALVVNTFFAYTVNLPDSVVGTVVAPIIEESMKALGPLLLFIYLRVRKRRGVDGVVDAIVYCGLSATGFAMMENIIYLGGRGYGEVANNLGSAMGVQTLVILFVVRIVMSGFAHPLFTSMTAIGLGLAFRSKSTPMRIFAPLAGWIAAMLLHSSWNLFPTLVGETGSGLYFLYGYLGFEMPLFFAMVAFVLWLRSWENRVVARNLQDYVRAGWFTPPEIASLLTVDRRLAARHWAATVAGRPGGRAMKAYQTTATRLGLLRDAMRRGLSDRPEDAARALADERQLLAEIRSYREVFTGRDRSVPAAYWDGTQYHLAFPDGVVRNVPAPPDPVVPVPVVLAPPAYPGGYPHPYPGR
jgi:RsiW-degrading membrane proteinase PrsW (M82 family)